MGLGTTPEVIDNGKDERNVQLLLAFMTNNGAFFKKWQSAAYSLKAHQFPDLEDKW